MKRKFSIVVAFLTVILMIVSAAYAGATERVSVDSSGNQANSGSASPSISADGSYVAFDSSASNLVLGDTYKWNS